jgi:hypothetical protein
MICAQGGAFGRQFADQTGIRVKPKRVLAYMFLRELDTGSHKEKASKQTKEQGLGSDSEPVRL